ncbi:LytTR family DNA-binding domain-containing protein [Sphingomicrobium aestuariivivum]|uniref:LytTR family DNA-binding domain-containing protein n=1 Tax=Sphingomicrobium aestuariivivum TaxID=1582356 RepID=UPI001FD6EE0A|nr:LytTR family DNA-binding domain-containing protein [Sphingomicrobium aestuariivivum]MCJ8191789.1 LytTR family transcriptional regulator [Sphingomicrobium aestuariivivum]
MRRETFSMPPRWRDLLVVGGLFGLGYCVVFQITGASSGWRFPADVFANILPLLLVGAATMHFWAGRGRSLRGLKRIGAHIVGAILFTFFWFWLLMIALGIVAGGDLLLFSVEPFLGPAATWQLYQGLLAYAVFSLLGERQPVPQAALETHDPPAAPFIKDEDGIRPLDLDRVVSLQGAGDYVEARTLSGSHLIRTTLGALESQLGPRFLRIHRSTLVAIDKVEQIEPAGGGKFSLRMRDGSVLTASRSGAKAIRERLL